MRFFLSCVSAVFFLIDPFYAQAKTVGHDLFLNFSHKQVWSKEHVENMISSEILNTIENHKIVDWDNIIEGFESGSERNSVIEIIADTPSEGMHDVYRFTVDRSNNPLAIILSFGPGNSNGVFTAIFSQEPDNKIYLIKRGGKPELLR